MEEPNKLAITQGRHIFQSKLFRGTAFTHFGVALGEQDLRTKHLTCVFDSATLLEFLSNP